MSPEPRGIVIGDGFADYIQDLRETWPRNDALAAKHGLPTGDGHNDSTMRKTSSTNDAQPAEPATTETTDGPSMGRRRYMQTLGATAVASVAGTGAVSAAGGGLNYGSELTPNVFVSATVVIDSYSGSEDSVLSFVDDSGNADSLENYGGVIADRPDPDQVHNPISLKASAIDAADFRQFPRDETFTDADGNEVDLDAIDAQHWSTDVSGSAGSITVEDYDTASGSSGLRISTSGQGSGDVALARFTDVSITTGELRRYIQTILDVPTLDTGATVEIRVEDSTGSQTATTIDTSADSTADATIATSTVTDHVYQQQLGGIASSVDGIEAIEVSIAGGNATLEFAALNFERESRWLFGEKEVLNSDNEIETESIYEPSGEFSITSLSTLGDVFSSATIRDRKLDVELRASGVMDSMVDVVEADPGRFRYDARLQIAQNIEIPTAYDLDWSGLDFLATVRHPSDRYYAVKSAVGLEESQKVADVEDLTTTDRTTDLENGSTDAEVVLEGSPSPGDIVMAFHDLLLTNDESGEITRSSVIGGPGMSSGSGGWLDYLFSVPGAIVSALMSVGIIRRYTGGN